MINNKFKALIILLLIIVVLLVVLWSWLVTKPVVSPSPYPSFIPITSPAVFVPQPSFPPLTNVIQKSVKYDVSQYLPGLPTVINNYQLIPPHDLNSTISNIASQFGFTANPKVTTFDTDISYSWTNNTFYSLSIYGSPLTINYWMPTPENLTNLTLTDDEYNLAAKTFLQSKNLIPPIATISPPAYTYFATQNLHLINTVRSQATIIQLEYWLQLDGYQLVTKYPNIPSFAFKFDSNKNLLSFTGYYLLGIEKPNLQTQVVSLDEAKNSLLQGRGSLLHVFSQQDKDRFETQQYFPTEIKVNNAQLAYYLMPEQYKLLPVMVFAGTSVDERSRKNLDTVTLLSAIK